MPELPDVEVVRRRLERGLRGATITSARSADRYILRPQSPTVLARALARRKVREVGRRGKWLRLLLDDGGRLFCHLGMTGWWVERGTGDPKERSERARIDVVRDGGRSTSLRYLDSRRFGRLVVAKEDIAQWRDLGPDPLADGIDADALASALAGSRRVVKEVVMDQSIIAGIGNILATEALWHARIDPRSRSRALSRADVGKIVRGLQTALRRELSARETSENDEWLDVFSVYGHAGEPCPRCGTLLSRVVIAGRSTVFCKHCQVRRGGGRRNVEKAERRSAGSR
jgi:formamidopyrimidine-DNA glycosylase